MRKSRSRVPRLTANASTNTGHAAQASYRVKQARPKNRLAANQLSLNEEVEAEEKTTEHQDFLVGNDRVGQHKRVRDEDEGRVEGSAGSEQLLGHQIEAQAGGGSDESHQVTDP